jgi:undecaprenyl-diphosphatase
MDLLKTIILGIVQGLTEFLPISSSGHLVLASDLLHFQEEGVAFEVFVHLGTLFSVLIAFRSDIIKMALAPFQLWRGTKINSDTREYALWDLYVIIGTIPAAVIGLMFKDQIESFFSNTILVIIMLSITGTILLISGKIKSAQGQITPLKSLLIGCAQAFAILPGISRSGSTIVTGMALGVDREKAARFSFILSIPAILGAFVLKMTDLMASSISSSKVLYLLTGTLAAFISGYIAIIWLMNLIKKGKLDRFAYYCYAIVIISLFWFVL